MRAYVYRLYLRGVKLPRPVQAIDGELILRGGDVGSNVPDAQIAELHWSSGRPGRLPSLYWARVRRITHRGVVVTGTEIIPRSSGLKASADHYRQTWWCLVGVSEEDAEEMLYQEGDEELPPVLPPEPAKPKAEAAPTPAPRPRRSRAHR